MNKIKNIITITTLALFAIGCRPPNIPDIEEIGTHETAFVFKLDGEPNSVKFDSAEALENNKVASKRIEVPKRWRHTGYGWQYWAGQHIPLLRVLKVDRTPVTTEWMPRMETSGSDVRKIGDGIWAESSDSIGFSTGFRLTGFVAEEDTAQFLYMYRGGALQGVLQGEVKTRVQELFTDFSAKYPLDTLRSKKGEMSEYIKTNTIPMFKGRGITISALAMTGGFTYENPEVQTAIDKVFVSQQEKEVASALLDAQTDKNARIKLEATALADAAREKAIGDSDAIKLVKGAEAEGIRLVNDAAEAAKSNPLVYKFRLLDSIEKVMERWNGDVPKWIMGNGVDTSLLIDPRSME